MRIDRALSLIPGGSSTMAKSCLRGFPPQTPSFAVSAAGATFIDDQGRQWIDCDMALGAVIWGFDCREVNEAIASQLSRGQIFSVPAVIEIDLAERILDRLRDFESIRFCKNGADAVAAAVRIARSATGRELVACGTYHGWLDWSAFHHYGANAALGIPRTVGHLTTWLQEETFAAYNRLDAKSYAAIVVCPEHWTETDLRSLRESCTRHGILLIFDEVKSGMRYGKRGVFGNIGVQPDLLCISKGMANGLPLAALIGSRELMRYAETVRFSNTHAGECISIAAALAGETMLKRKADWPSWRDEAAAMISGLTPLAAPRGLAIAGEPGLFALRPTEKSLSAAFREHFVKTLASNSVFTTGSIALSDAHTAAQIEHIRAATERATSTWESER